MIGKLLSTAANSKESASLKDGLIDSSKEKGKLTNSKNVFKSLLKALQGEESSGGKQNMLTATSAGEEQESGTKQEAKLSILGGTFSNINTESSKDGETDGQQLLNVSIPEGSGPKTQQVSEDDAQKDAPHVEGKEQKKDKTSESEEGGKRPVNSSGEESKITGNNADIASQQVVEKKELTGSEQAESKKLVEKPENGKVEKPKSSSAGSNTKQNKKTQAASVIAQNASEKSNAGDSQAAVSSNEQQETGKKVTQAAVSGLTDESGEKSKAKVDEQIQKKQVDQKSADKKTPIKSAENGGKIDEKSESIATKVEKKVQGGREAPVENKSNSAQKNVVAASSSSEKNKVSHTGDTSTEPPEDKQANQSAKTDKPKEKLAQNTNRQKTNKQRPLNDVKKAKEYSGKEKATSEVNKNQVSDLRGADGRQAKSGINEKQKQIIDHFFSKNTTGNVSEKWSGLKGAELEKSRKKQKAKGSEEQDNKGRSATSTRNDRLARLGALSNTRHNGASGIDSHNFSEGNTDSSDFTVKDHQVTWEQGVRESSDSQEDGESKKNTISAPTAKLGQIPITNASLRRKIIPGLTKQVLKAASEAKKAPGQWQKHNFVLDDGKKVQLSVRESKGVLQVKMGSMNMDLSKVLQQNLQQIREHLRQEFGTDVDLQFESHGQQDSSAFSEDSRPSESKGGYSNRFSTNKLTFENAEQSELPTVRNFGYNNMEWTA
jgi:hypothetical protein